MSFFIPIVILYGTFKNKAKTYKGSRGHVGILVTKTLTVRSHPLHREQQYDINIRQRHNGEIRLSLRNHARTRPRFRHPSAILPHLRRLPESGPVRFQPSLQPHIHVSAPVLPQGLLWVRRRYAASSYPHTQALLPDRELRPRDYRVADRHLISIHFFTFLAL